jgi:membrane protease YdiL (CAAX protease family)
MLFLLKRTWQGSLAGLAVLLLLALGLRYGLGGGTPLEATFQAVGLGLMVFAGVVGSDGLLHGFFGWVGGAFYRQRFQDLVGVFRQQSIGAMVAGSLMAGVGEEPLFRGVGTNPLVLAGAAILFGLLHHMRWTLWPFTVWAIYEGFLFAVALYLTGNLIVTMVAHFLHDLVGFWIFRYEANRVAKKASAAAGSSAGVSFL